MLITDTFTTEEYIRDTTVILGALDTLIIENDRFRTEVIRRMDTFEVTTTIKADTIIREIEVPVQKLVYKERVPRWIWWVLAILGGLIIVKYVFRFFRF